MYSFKASILIKNADLLDYDRLDKEMEAASFRTRQKKFPQLDGGREYEYRGKGTLVDVTSATNQAVHRSGKLYSFTITRYKPRVV